MGSRPITGFKNMNEQEKNLLGEYTNKAKELRKVCNSSCLVKYRRKNKLGDWGFIGLMKGKTNEQTQ